MSKSVLSTCTLVAAVMFSASNSFGQATGVAFPGIVTNKLGMPTIPTAIGSAACTGSSYTYAVAALDFAGSSTKESNSSTGVPCTPGGSSGAQYVKVTTPAVTGSASCNVFRTGPSSTGLIGNVVCGGVLLDTGQAPGTTTAPSIDQTGGVSVVGVMVAQSFNANAGGNAGTSAWVSAGGQLPPCPSSVACVPQDSFFVQAPNAITTTFGWTLPAASNAANQLVYAGPTVTDSGGKQAAPLGYIAADSTASHALFATSTQPAFRLIGTSDTSVNWIGTGGGSAQLQTAAMPQTVTALAPGLEVDWKPMAANTGAGPTLQVDSTSPQPITKCGTAPLIANDLTTTAIAKVVYDGSNFQLQNPQAADCTSVTTLCAGSSASVPLGGKLYFGFGTNSSSTNEPGAYLPIATSGTVVALHATVSATPAQQITIHARYKGANFTSDLTCPLTTSVTSCDVTGGTQSIVESTNASPTNWDIEADAANSGSASSRNYAICLKVVGAN